MDAVTNRSLKRKFEEVDVGSPISTSKDSDDEISNSDSAESCDSVNTPTTTGLIPTSILKRQKPLRQKNVRFDQVTVYYFSRRQGFTSVPSQGGSSLGMAQRHNSVHKYTLCEFAQEQEVSHREVLREHLKEEKLHTRKLKLTKNGTVESEEAEGLTLEDVSDDDIDVDNVEVDDYFFLQPLPTKRRRAMLRSAGIHRIDAEEKQELRAIRLSREECGCDCRLYCDPEACPCSQAGIKCQVDRMSFPCGCSRDGCSNIAGRIEFNPIRVRTHYLHTIMKLELENKRQQPRPQPPEEEHPHCSLGVTQHQDTQDFQEFIAENYYLENEAAVRHLQSAEERQRLLDEGDEASSGSSLSLDSSVESLEVCLLETPISLPSSTCHPSITPVLLPASSSVLCFSDEDSGRPASPAEYTDGNVTSLYAHNHTSLDPEPEVAGFVHSEPAEPSSSEKVEAGDRTMTACSEGGPVLEPAGTSSDLAEDHSAPMTQPDRAAESSGAEMGRLEENPDSHTLWSGRHSSAGGALTV
ncbi:cysteine/serine-rich nuclear protein 2 [Ascaphus truei]|uniref:cysteine/serine-rich nuclear protein 2 n=1 Tax=Ascaphus truei TaxID=8439 RepID=UPI003F59D44B